MQVDRRAVETRGHRLSYLAWGDGPPLVLVSGALQAAEDWVTAGYADALPDFRVLAVDPLGFGESDKPHDVAEYRLDGRTVDLDAVLEAEAISSALWWGYSIGAIQVEAYARSRPARTRAIVLGGIVPGLTAADRRNVGVATIASYENGNWEAVWRDALPFVPVERRPEWERRNDLVAAAASSRGSWEQHSADGAALTVPQLCYVGTDEWFWEVARAAAEGLGATFVALEGADHAVAFRRVDAAAEFVRPFLRGHA